MDIVRWLAGNGFAGILYHLQKILSGRPESIKLMGGQNKNTQRFRAKSALMKVYSSYLSIGA